MVDLDKFMQEIGYVPKDSERSQIPPSKENQSQDGVVEWPSGMSWRRGGMPPLNQRVLAYCEGAQYHSGASWFRNGYAFMVHHNCNTVGPGWGRSFYDDACRQLGADELTVIAWMPLEKPEWATR